jgi:AcrR family transcriptional regulator
MLIVILIEVQSSCKGGSLRYAPEHKEKVRQRILGHAARLFRRHGYEGVGIDAIMEAARLTRGGFYGHFRSKAALFAAVVNGKHDFAARLRARTGTSRAELTDEAVAVTRGYLDPANRERVGRGCTLASLSCDVARAPREARQAYEGAVDDLAGELSRALSDPAERDPRALSAIALCVGGLTLARGVDDAAFAEEILAACSVRVERELRSGADDDSRAPRTGNARAR